MLRWDARFQVMGPSPAFPVFHNCSVETQYDASYHCEGPQRHEEICLFDLTLDGEGVFRDSAGERALTAGKVFLRVLNATGSADYYPPGGKGGWTFLWACFSGGGAGDMVRSLLARHGPVCSMAMDSAFVGWLLSLRASSGKIRAVSPAESGKMVMDLLAAVEAAMLSNGSPYAAEDLLVGRAQEIVLAGMGRGVGVAEAAKELGVSRGHLSRVFSQRVGTSLQDWAQRRRMALAARLLGDEGLSCKETAWRLGYVSQANFARAFRKTTGLRPGKFKASGSWLPL